MSKDRSPAREVPSSFIDRTRPFLNSVAVLAIAIGVLLKPDSKVGMVIVKRDIVCNADKGIVYLSEQDTRGIVRSYELNTYDAYNAMCSPEPILKPYPIIVFPPELNP